MKPSSDPSNPQISSEVPQTLEGEGDEQKDEKFVDAELLNDDAEESNLVEKMVQDIKPYFSHNILPKSIYLQKTVLPLIYEALNETEKKRPEDPVEFFCVYLLDKNGRKET